MAGGGGVGGSGGCGKDCLGGACINDTCQPVVIVTNQPGIVGVALDDTYVYWTTGPNSRVMRQDRAGNMPPQQLDDAQGNYVSYIDIYAGRLYWTESPGSIRSAQLDGSDQQLVQNGFANPTGLEVTPTRIYSSEYTASGSVLSFPIGGGPQLDMESDLDFPEEVSTNAAGDVFWTVNATGVVAKRPNGGATEILVSGLDQPSGIEVDATHIYFCTEGPGEVLRRLHSGGAPEVIANGTQPTGIAVTNTAIAWGDFTDGTIRLLAK